MCPRLRVGEQEAAEERVHLEAQEDWTLLHLGDRLQNHQDSGDEEDREGEDNVQVSERDQVCDGDLSPWWAPGERVEESSSEGFGHHHGEGGEAGQG